MFTDKIKEEIKAQALAEFPKEGCGVVVVFKGKPRYVACKNVHLIPENDFIISPEDFLTASQIGEIVAIAHSHPNSSSQPSVADKVSQAETELPWLIYSVRDDNFTEFNDGEIPPLYGRSYHHGVLDCLSFVRDFYKQEFNIHITNYHREDDWWNKGQNLYLDLYEAEGFAIIPEMKDMEYGDLLLMSLKSPVPNHGAIYVGNNKVGHHAQNRLSSIDIYGDFLRNRTNLILRHKNNVKKD